MYRLGLIFLTILFVSKSCSSLGWCWVCNGIGGQCPEGDPPEQRAERQCTSSCAKVYEKFSDGRKSIKRYCSAKRMEAGCNKSSKTTRVIIIQLLTHTFQQTIIYCTFRYVTNYHVS